MGCEVPVSILVVGWGCALAHEGIVAPFFAKGRYRAVAGHKFHVIAKGPEPVTDSPYQAPMITPGEVGTADRSLEQNIAYYRQT